MIKEVLLTKKWSLDTDAPLGKPGGFGAVFKGRSVDGAPVAIKQLYSVERGHRELDFARYALGREGKNVVTILDCGIVAPDHGFIVMELADQTLRDVMNASKDVQMAENEVLQLVAHTCKGLLEAGDWIHRDIKPENILKVGDDWKIADFGIARPIEGPTSIHTMKLALSPYYAAPEQWHGQTATKRTDIYSLGCIAFEMLAGRKVFGAASVEELREKHCFESPVLTVGSPQTRMLVLRMLSKPELARPFPSEVLSALASVENSNAGGVAATKLAAVAMRISDIAAKAEAERLRKEAALSSRRELQRAAESILDNILAELFARAAAVVSKSRPVATHFGAARTYEFELGGSKLEATIGETKNVSEDAFMSAKADVICADHISISTRKYRRSSSLYYMNKGDGFHWYEVCFYSVVPNVSSEPCFLSPGRDAVLAMSPISHSWQIAYGPKQLVGEGMEIFFERWLGFLADGADGSLRYPSALPER